MWSGLRRGAIFEESDEREVRGQRSRALIAAVGHSDEHHSPVITRWPYSGSYLLIVKSNRTELIISLARRVSLSLSFSDFNRPSEVKVSTLQTDHFRKIAAQLALKDVTYSGAI